MIRFLMMVLLSGAFVSAHAGMDLTMQAREIRLIFKDGSELDMRSDGKHIVSARLNFRGKVFVLPQAAFQGIAQPDLTTVQVKLVGVNPCVSEGSWCLNYSKPMIIISVMGIPEHPECLEECLVSFMIEGDSVRRETSSRQAGKLTTHPRQVFPM